MPHKLPLQGKRESAMITNQEVVPLRLIEKILVAPKEGVKVDKDTKSNTGLKFQDRG